MVKMHEDEIEIEVEDERAFTQSLDHPLTQFLPLHPRQCNSLNKGPLRKEE